MRIISGKFKSLVIPIPSYLKIRPTTDMAKQGLFNILENQFDFKELKILDLFSGSGSISFEFASRGAVNICSIDKNPKCIRFIRNFSSQLNLEQIIIPVQKDSLQFLNNSDLKYDLIFADPPFDYEHLTLVQEIIFSKKLLRNEGIFILEHSSRIQMNHLKGFQRSVKYGDIVFSFFGGKD